MAKSATPDVIIIGSGMGGGTAALRLAQGGARVLLLERGGYLPREDDNWSLQAVFNDKKYTAHDRWIDIDNKPFRPAIYYYVGGMTKFYGCTLFRLRERDFQALEHYEGLSPAWPITYQDLEKYYAIAETQYHLHGASNADPSEAKRSSPFPFPGVTHDPPMQAVVDRIAGLGLKPFSQPASIRLPPKGNCIRCLTCDGYPCKIDAKVDAEMATVLPALATGKVELWTNATVERLVLAPDGKSITSVDVRHNGELKSLSAKIIVLSASAVNSAALLLRSADTQAPQGVANRSGVVGRNYMAHNNTAMMAVAAKRNDTVFAKTVAMTDFYFGEPDFPYPMGTVISLGKLQAGMLTAGNPMVPMAINRMLAARSFDWWIMSEDLPDPDNRVTIEGGTIKLAMTRNNLKSHSRLVARMKKVMRQIGLPLTLTKLMPVLSTSHQCGTVRFGDDPETSALDPFCRAHDHSNLYVIDGSFFPSSAAVNPALTIAAQALRASDHILRTSFGVTTAGADAA